MNIAVIGSGYVGLVTSACLSDLGHAVTCVDTDAAKVERLSSGEVPIFEPGLGALIAKGLHRGTLSFTTDHSTAARDAEVVFIAVGTPASRDGEADLRQVIAAVTDLAPHMGDGVVVALKSTVPVGTTTRVKELLSGAAPELDFSIVSNPEFLRQGSAVADFIEPDRVVVGSCDERGEAIMRTVYQPMLDMGIPGLFVSLESSEIVKCASNAFLATKLSFINEVADLCEATGASIDEVAEGMGLDPRISNSYLGAGPGYGGSCLPKDTVALIHTSREHGTSSHVVSAAVEANLVRKHVITNKIATALEVPIERATVAVLGLTYKADTDDLRESPAIDIVRGLVKRGAKVTAYDPQGMDRAREAVDIIEYAGNAYDAMRDADAVVILTDWDEFRSLDLDKAKSLLTTPLMIDTRNLFDPTEMEHRGFVYASTGRSTVGI